MSSTWAKGRREEDEETQKRVTETIIRGRSLSKLFPTQYFSNVHSKKLYFPSTLVWRTSPCYIPRMSLWSSLKSWGTSFVNFQGTFWECWGDHHLKVSSVPVTSAEPLLPLGRQTPTVIFDKTYKTCLFLIHVYMFVYISNSDSVPDLKTNPPWLFPQQHLSMCRIPHQLHQGENEMFCSHPSDQSYSHYKMLQQR